jgi:hypothetical protein
LQKGTAAALVDRFHDQWLQIEEIAELNKSPELYKGFSAATEASLRDSLRASLAHVFWDADSLDELFTGAKAAVDANVAKIYGIAGPAKGWAVAGIDPAGNRRAGFLTHPGWLALHTSRTCTWPSRPPTCGTARTTRPRTRSSTAWTRASP